MDDSYFAELDAADIERFEDDPPTFPNNIEGNEPSDLGEAAEATESKRVKPKKHIVNPRPKLDDKRLKSNRGLVALEPLFEKVHLRGKGHEVKDLNTVMSVLEHWAHRLFPRMTFDDALEKIEELGHKRSVSSYMTLLRADAIENQMDIEDNDLIPPRPQSPPVEDPFDRLIEQQDQQEPELTEQQRAMIERNRLLAEERRLARMKAKYESAADCELPNHESSQLENQSNLSDLTYLEQNTQQFTDIASKADNREHAETNTSSNCSSKVMDTPIQLVDSLSQQKQMGDTDCSLEVSTENNSNSHIFSKEDVERQYSSLNDSKNKDGVETNKSANEGITSEIIEDLDSERQNK